MNCKKCSKEMVRIPYRSSGDNEIKKREICSTCDDGNGELKLSSKSRSVDYCFDYYFNDIEDVRNHWRFWFGV